MDSGDNSNQLHPNLARLAAQYDAIIDDMDGGRLTPAQARSKISQLETRDDHGIRWSIDPDTGEFIRKSAFGELEYDTPPTSGVLTHDPFTLNNEFRDDDPNLRLAHTEVDLVAPPSQHFGATHSAFPDLGPSMPGALRNAPLKQKLVKLGAAAGAGVLIAGLAFAGTQVLGNMTDTAPSPSTSDVQDTEQTAETPSKKKSSGGKDGDKQGQPGGKSVN